MVKVLTNKVTESLRRQTVYNLAKQPIKIASIFEDKEIPFLLYPRDESRALRRAIYRTEKYIAKKNIDTNTLLGSEIVRKFLTGHTCRALVDEAVNTVLGFYGISGGLQLDYKQLAYKIMKIVKDYHVLEWEKRINSTLDDWMRKHEVNEDALRAVALASAKVTAEFYYGQRWSGVEHFERKRPIRKEQEEIAELKGEGEEGGNEEA